MKPALFPHPFAIAKDVEVAEWVMFGANSNRAGKPDTVADLSLETASVTDETEVADFCRNSEKITPCLGLTGATGKNLFDAGNLDVAKLGKEEQVKAIESTVLNYFKAGKKVAVIGDDHLTKYAVMHAAAQRYGKRMAFIYLDAQPNTQAPGDLFYGNILSTLFEQKAMVPSQVFLWGVRCYNSNDWEGLQKWQPGFLSMTELELLITDFDGVHISLDLDGLHPGDAPAVRNPIPGGIGLQTVTEIIHRIQNISPIISFATSGFLKNEDIHHQTAFCVNRILKEVVSG